MLRILDRVRRARRAHSRRPVAPQQIGGQFDLGALLLAPYAEQAGVTVNPRLGVWDPLTLQVVPADNGL